VIACDLILGRDRKRDLLLSSPLLGASGALGHAPLEGTMWRQDLLGALVTPQLCAEPKPSFEPPQTLATAAGVLVAAAGSPTLRTALRRHGQGWRRWGLPVIVAIGPASTAEAGRMAEELAAYDWVQAVELDLGDELPAHQRGDCVQAVRSQSPFPCLVRVPFDDAVGAAAAAENAGADGIVVAAPPSGRLRTAEGRWVQGRLHSPALAPLYAQRLCDVATVTVAPLIARGEISSPQDALTMLAAGASALQLDSILWVRPGIIEEVYAALQAEMSARSISRWGDFLAALQGECRSSAG